MLFLRPVCLLPYGLGIYHCTHVAIQVCCAADVLFVSYLTESERAVGQFST